MNTLAYLQNHLNGRLITSRYPDGMYIHKNRAPHILCRDGTVISVQTGSNYYCTPQHNNGPWSCVQIDYVDPLSIADENKLLPYKNASSYHFVPIDIVVDIIDSHKGIY